MRTNLFLVVMFVLTAIAASACTMNSISVSGTKLTVGGTGFSSTPLSLTFNGKSVSISSSSSTQIVGTLSAMPTTGSYRVGLKCDTASTSGSVTIPAPNVVETLALFDQSISINTTPFWTPSKTGLYRITMYIREYATSLAEYTLAVTWEDQAGTELFQANVGDTFPLEAFAERPARFVAGQPVSYSASIGAGLGTPPQYEFVIVIEQLTSE
jgi:hypothetical protein